MNNNNPQIMALNLEQIAINSSLSSITRMTAATILRNPYLTLADFFKGLTNNDLTVLNFMANSYFANKNNTTIEDIESIDNLLMMSMMLALAEGVPPTDDLDIKMNFDFFISIIACESLKRRGLVEITYENMSFGADMSAKPFVKLKDGFNSEDFF